MKLERASREPRSLRFEAFRKKCKTDTDAFKNIVSEVERLECLGQNKDQSNYSMHSVLCTAVEGMEWNLHSLAKQGVENDFPKEVGAIDDSIEKFDLLNSSRQPHSFNHRDERATLYKREISSSDEDIKMEENQESADVYLGRRFDH